jgi:hypothetical protein
MSCPLNRSWLPRGDVTGGKLAPAKSPGVTVNRGDAAIRETAGDASETKFLKVVCRLA